MSEGHEITRRSLLLASPALLSIGATPVLAEGMAIMATPSLQQLIDTHDAAYRTFNDACGKLMEAEDAVSKMDHLQVSAVICADGTVTEAMELGPYSADDIRRNIISRHAELRRIHCGTWSKRMAPELVDALGAALDRSHAMALEQLDQALDAMVKRNADAGIPALQQLVDEAALVESSARLDLLLYRPVTRLEAEQKAVYISASVPFSDGWDNDEDFRAALIKRFGEVA